MIEESKLKELALLPPLEYDQARERVAKENGVRVSTLDSEVYKHRPPPETSNDESEPELVTGVEPWHEVVDGKELANSIENVIKKYCVLSEHTVAAVTLWVIASYGIDAYRIFSMLAVSSPQKRCGKTTFLEVASAFTSRSLLTSNITPSVLFRMIERFQPTVIIDEMDTFLEGNEELRGIVNAGHTKKLAYVWRTEGENREPTRFTVWAPKILAKIGTYPDTIIDRSVAVELKRKLAGDHVDRIPSNLDDRQLTKRRQCQRWSNDNFNYLSKATPTTPKVANDRAEDNWLPLLAVADRIGGTWPDKARNAMRSIEAAKVQEDSEDLSISLLQDIQKLITKHRWTTVIHSARLVELLNLMDERPWPTLRNDKGISAHKLASLLKPFGVRSGSKRDPNTKENLKGYAVDQLDDVFTRYLARDTPNQSVTTSQPHKNAGYSQNQSVTPTNDVTDSKPLTASSNGACDVVTLSEGKKRSKDGNLYPSNFRTPT